VYARQQKIRAMLEEKGLVSFIANGSILPRSPFGTSLKGAVPFKSPPEDEVSLRMSNRPVLKL
jgi:predicted ABC-class ATPase